MKNNPDYINMDMDAYDIMMVHANSKELEGLRSRIEREGGNMCKGLADWAAEERAEGRLEGIVEGRMEGIAEGKEIGLRNLVATLKDYCDDFERLYAAVVKNEDYCSLSREAVKRYYYASSV